MVNTEHKFFLLKSEHNGIFKKKIVKKFIKILCKKVGYTQYSTSLCYCPCFNFQITQSNQITTLIIRK